MKRNNNNNTEMLVLKDEKGQPITTSLLVAKEFHKEHRNVLRDIENLDCSQEFRALNFERSSYTTSQNKELPMYKITKDGFAFLVMGYSGEKAGLMKEKFLNAFNKMESLLKSDDYILLRAMNILTDRTKVLEEQVQQKEKQLQLQSPKVEYYENVLQSSTLIPTNVIAKELGTNAFNLHNILHKRGIIYRSGDTWVLYSKYEHLGFMGTKTMSFVDRKGKSHTLIHSYWTEKGREFIHKLFS